MKAPLAVLLCVFLNNVASLRNVRVLFPKSVSEGGSATLLCLYDLQGEQLYSVKWYRGSYEIFRYLPKENPRIRIFALPGLNIDLNMSNSHRLTLVHVPKYLGGNYTCEVTAEEPAYSTGYITDYLQVFSRNTTESSEDELFENYTKLKPSVNETLNLVSSKANLLRYTNFYAFCLLKVVVIYILD